MKLVILFLAISFDSASQIWLTQSIGGSSAVVTSPTSQFVIDEHRNSIWLISDSTASVIENDGTLYNFSTTDLESSMTGGNMKFAFSSDHIYYSIKNVGLKTFDAYSPQFVFGLADIRELFSDLDTVFMVTDNVLQYYHPATGAVNTFVTSSNGNARKNGHTYIDFGSAAYAVGPFSAVTLTADPTYLTSPMNDFTFSRFTDSIYVGQETGISMAYQEQVYDTITQNNTTNMPSANVLDIRFDMNNDLWGIFGDPTGQPFAIAMLSATNWINSYTNVNSPINFSNFQGLEFDTFNNLWVAETFKLHTLNSATTPGWLNTIALTKSKINLFPNPTQEFLSFESENPIAKIELMDLSGKILYFSQKNLSINPSIDVSKIQAGMYLAIIHLQNDSVQSIKWQKH